MKRSLLLAFAALTALPVMANAQTYDRMVSFGDSLTDNGNLFLVSGQPPAPYNRRFTNQLTWAEYMAGTMATGANSPATTAGSINFAFGGSRTDTVATPGPGIATQVNGMFLGAGGTLGGRNVISMWGGANDLFQALPGAGANPATAASVMTGVATTAATNIYNSLNALTAAGGKTFLVFNLPELGGSPQFSADPSASGLSTLSSQAFNSSLNTRVNQLAAANTSVNYVQVDMATAFNMILANPSAYGFANVTQQCVLVTACVTGSDAVRNTYLFWDGVHPTGGGQRAVAAIATQLLYTQSLTSGVGALAEGSYTNRLGQASDAGRRGTYKASEGEGYSYMELIGSQASRDMNLSAQSTVGGAVATTKETALDQDLKGFRAGVVTMLSANKTLTIGGALLAGDVEGMGVDANANDISLDAGLTWHNGKAFYGINVGAGQTLYSNYRRGTLLKPINLSKNQVTATSYSAGFTAGHSHKSDKGSLTPMLRVNYTTATMDGFTEIGEIAHVKFENRNVSSLNAAVELHGTHAMSDTMMIGGMIGYEGHLSQDNGDLKGKLQNNTAKAFTQKLGDLSAPGVLVGLGVSKNMGDFKVKVKYSGTFGEEDTTSQSGMISVSRNF
jgi:outer membrane lipase/esterase